MIRDFGRKTAVLWGIVVYSQPDTLYGVTWIDPWADLGSEQNPSYQDMQTSVPSVPRPRGRYM